MHVNFVALRPDDLAPIYAQGWDSRINFDGRLTVSAGDCHSYAQLFRNGVIEAVESLLLEPQGQEKLLPTQEFERHLIAGLSEYFRLARQLALDTPWFVMITLLGVRGYSLGLSSRYNRTSVPIDRDTLLIPEIIVEDERASAHRVLRPAFDAVWQAGGMPGSRNYDDDGNWVVKL